MQTYLTNQNLNTVSLYLVSILSCNSFYRTPFGGCLGVAGVRRVLQNALLNKNLCVRHDIIMVEFLNF